MTCDIYGDGVTVNLTNMDQIEPF